VRTLKAYDISRAGATLSYLTFRELPARCILPSRVDGMDQRS
jgi:hypothetical protein